MNQNTWTMLQKYPEELIQALADLMQEKSDFCYISVINKLFDAKVKD
jgi:hypothetical protein